jgi:orotate phosphoribosyltransferase
MSASEAGDILGRLPLRDGHFRLESGHHGERWLDLESLCLDVAAVRGLARRLGRRLSDHGIDAVCGPLVEGAFVALMVAEQLAVPFTYAVPQPPSPKEQLFPVAYRIPGRLRAKLAGRRVAVVNDVIGAGSAVRGTLDDLRAAGARAAAIGTLAVAGDAAARLAADNGVPLETLARLDHRIWTPAECPLCAEGVPLVDVAAGES